MNEAHCVVCGCTEYSACFDPSTGHGCSWLMPPDENGEGLCSVCADPERVGMIVLGILPYRFDAPRAALVPPIAEIVL